MRKPPTERLLPSVPITADTKIGKKNKKKKSKEKYKKSKSKSKHKKTADRAST